MAHSSGSSGSSSSSRDGDHRASAKRHQKFMRGNKKELEEGDEEEGDGKEEEEEEEEEESSEEGEGDVGHHRLLSSSQSASDVEAQTQTQQQPVRKKGQGQGHGLKKSKTGEESELPRATGLLHGGTSAPSGSGTTLTSPTMDPVEMFLKMNSSSPVGLIVGGILLFVGTEQLGLIMFVILGIGLTAVGLVHHMVVWLLHCNEGPVEMQSIADAIKEGSSSFFNRVYGTIAVIAAPITIVIFGLYYSREVSEHFVRLGSFQMAVTVSVCFLVGALCSAIAGYVGLWVSVRANVRVAASATQSYQATLQMALRGGFIAGLIVVTLVVLGIALLFAGIYLVYGIKNPGDQDQDQDQQAGVAFAYIPILLVGYSFGASFVALFAQLGGGIFTKAADVGADLVGKLERDIPEDDPRNPAVIADLVGDNVGDCSARGADLFESIAAEIISAMILGGALSLKCNMSSSETMGYVMFPLVIHAFDLVVSSIGVFSISAQDKKNSHGKTEPDLDPLDVMKRAYLVSLFCAMIGFVIATRWLLFTESAPFAWRYFAGCGVVGMLTAYFTVLLTQYYTDSSFTPVRKIAKASTSGHATNIISGLATGMESTVPAIFLMSFALLFSYWLGTASGLQDGTSGKFVGGLFGTAVATMGMLSCAVYVLAMDIFGPISDNAGGIVEMSGQPESVRVVTDKLDSVGNTTKAATKGYAVGSAVLACFLLFRAFMDEVTSFSGKSFDSVDIAIPEVFISGLWGSTLVYSFASMAMQAVGDTAQAVVEEVRRQFRDMPGIVDGSERPQYGTCVDIISKASLSKMVKPGLMVVLSPCAVGLFFREVGKRSDQPLLGPLCVASFLMFSTAAGVLMALFLNNAGGAWDNTKKYIESGEHGGKNSEAHKASITGDTVGDPCKDTAGPSLHILIKALSTVTLLFVPLFL